MLTRSKKAAMMVQLCTNNNPPSFPCSVAVMREQGGADCAFEMHNGVKEEPKISKSAVVISLLPMYSSLFLISGFIIKMVGIHKFLFGLYLLIGVFAIPATINLVHGFK